MANIKLMRISILNLLLLFSFAFGISDHAVAMEPALQGRFISGVQNIKRIPADFALRKVDNYNKQAKRDGSAPITYQAYWLTMAGNEKALDFVFDGLTPEQFQIVKMLYGGVSRTEPKAKRATYRLVDFMPPLVQALNGMNFKYAQAQVPEINEGRTGAYRQPNGPVDAYVTTSVNCWATVYGFLRSQPFNPTAEPGPFTVFYTGRFQAYDFFSQLGQNIVTVSIAQKHKAVLPRPSGSDQDIEFGDVLLVVTTRQLLRDVETDLKGRILSSTPGSKITAMEHAAIYIDDGLIFEKSNGGDYDPFRFMPLGEALKNYTSEGDIQIEVRRYHDSLPDPRVTFGGTAYATSEDYKRPLNKPLEKILVMSKEILFPQEGEYYNSFSQAVDVSLTLDDKTGRFKLGSEAFRVETFDVRKNLANLCERVLSK